ncbi:DUF1134 domain-containing protein [Allochromatium humboldtianum]|uniref:DUF1134 domain-containing protein n=1 Tax=Allochromatium humboldtianum TaxID=504901 RepID=A0A850RI06_9GAMM|nr:DUF1134 domain-containing protein [Allochromatium humboldtianum]NVZ09231.1 DUF1134 domain-containing protein [Allochromatium humboldtianum]
MIRPIAAGLLCMTTFALSVQAQTPYTGGEPSYAQEQPGYYPSDVYPPPGAQTYPDASAERQTYGEQEILAKVEGYFGQGAENLAMAVQKVFREQGEPNGYIAGEEFGAALGIGLRYGRGVLSTRQTQDRPVFWQGPSIGLDLGVNVAKVFILIYRLPGEEYLFQRFPGVEGSLYLIGGVGVNYLQSGDTVIAPIRLGAGWRQGVSAGYMDFTKRVHYNPF